MTRVKSGRGGTVLLWLIGLMLLGCLQPGVAQDEISRNALVLIRITVDDDRCTLEVGPRGVGVCHSPKGDCDNFVTWRWIGSDHGYDKILISQKPESPARDCFDVPVTLNIPGESDFRPLRTVDGEPPASCDPSRGPILWTYMVQAIRSEEDKRQDENCEMDPGVVIER